VIEAELYPQSSYVLYPTRTGHPSCRRERDLSWDGGPECTREIGNHGVNLDDEDLDGS
jgi:hypothetical protein